jgi:hypothetical protein
VRPGADAAGLGRLYRVMSASPDSTPVIVIPGLFGSKLRNRDTGVEVWPGPLEARIRVSWSCRSHTKPARRVLVPAERAALT